ncbi:hypothetical protein CTAYLR_005314 [Chrysophaeum taylorii]|uniref:Uncharacterized protein n=1 Tax=Chrysophaeum taylorii TaxID=2483200 RepID=A0AAD7UK10_9STRA|nr:hypothetical protein CTAYLR_005314 [Chrysophaeum taylorii]
MTPDSMSLRIDFFESETEVSCSGSLLIPLDELLASKEPTTTTTKGWGPTVDSKWNVTLNDSNTCTFCLRARRLEPSVAFNTPRVVFAVRHAESRWNQAVSRGNVVTMLTQVDHGLSSKGVCQALELSSVFRQRPRRAPKAIEDARTVEDFEQLFLSAPVLSCSPLKRAVQTALLALQGHPATSASGIRLLPFVREVRNAYGRDNIACARGDDIKETAVRDLRRARNTDSERAVLTSINVDTADTLDEWWSPGAEDAGQIRQRARDFLTFVKLLDAATCVVVTHSNFLRHLFRAHCSGDHDLSRFKVANCAVLAVILDFARQKGSEIADAKFLFGSGLEARGERHLEHLGA